MKRLKNAVGRTDQHMHKIEDARVKVTDTPQQKDDKGEGRWKTKVVNAAKVVKRIPYYVWLWEKGVEGWGWFCENVGSIFEVIS